MSHCTALALNKGSDAVGKPWTIEMGRTNATMWRVSRSEAAQGYEIENYRQAVTMGYFSLCWLMGAAQAQEEGVNQKFVCLFIYLLCALGLFAYLYSMHYLLACCPWRSGEGCRVSLEVELQTVVSHHVGAGHQTQGLCESKCVSNH